MTHEHARYLLRRGAADAPGRSGHGAGHRDLESFPAGHIENAIHAVAIDIDSFVAREDKNKPLLACRYHGISSQSAAEFFAANGFTRIYSLDGGYASWSES